MSSPAKSQQSPYRSESRKPDTSQFHDGSCAGVTRETMTGVDSAESCRAMLVERDARRLALAGVQVPRNADGTPAALVEISPRCVVDDADAVEYFRTNPVTETIQPGQTKAFGK